MSTQNTPYQPWMHSLLNRMKELYGKTDAKTISEALPDGDFFQIKGAVDEVSDLPASDNNVGDIYIVSEDGGEYIWVTSEDHPDGYWEQLGANITPESIGAEPAKVVVTVTESGGVYSADKTLDEIRTAYANGNTPVVKFVDDIYELSYTDFADFAFSVCIDSKIKQFHLNFTGSGGTWFYTETTVQSAQSTVTVSGTTPTVTPAANTIYKCGTLTSLTISNPPATGSYSIVFTSGATPTAAIIPPTPAMRWQTDDNEPPQGFPAANTRYEINVEDSYVILGEWPVPEVSA